MLHRRTSSAIFCSILFLTLAAQSIYAVQDKQEEKLGPKSEPAAMGSDYQPLLWRGTDAAFALDTLRFGSCQLENSGLVGAKSSNQDLQQLATRSIDLQQQNIKKLKSMAKAIGFRFPSKKQAALCTEAQDASARSEEDFERSYLDYLSKDNAAAMARFEAESDSLPDSANFDLKKFASAALPALAEQQRSIDELKHKLAGPNAESKPK